MSISKGPHPYKRESRPVIETERLHECLLAGDSSDSIIADLRRQRLKLLGVIGQRASVLASMVWESAA